MHSRGALPHPVLQEQSAETHIPLLTKGEADPGTRMAGAELTVGSQTHPRNEGCALPMGATSDPISIWQRGGALNKTKEYYFGAQTQPGLLRMIKTKSLPFLNP